MFKYLLSPTLIIGFLLAGCNSLGTQQKESSEFERRELPRQLTEQETELVNGSGHFGLIDWLRRPPDQSHFISPLSIQMAYGMAMNGAEGDTYNSDAEYTWHEWDEPGRYQQICQRAHRTIDPTR